jgi:hypothetical protein
METQTLQGKAKHHTSPTSLMHGGPPEGLALDP